MPLYDILNEFQKGSSHMAAVVKVKETSKNSHPSSDEKKFEENKVFCGDSQLKTPLLAKNDGVTDVSDNVKINIEKTLKSDIDKQTSTQTHASEKNLHCFSEDIEDGEVIGIITLEDVFEELLQVSSASTS